MGQVFSGTESAQMDRCFVGNCVFGDFKLENDFKVKYQNVLYIFEVLVLNLSLCFI